MKSLLRNPVVWRVLWALVMVAIAIRLSIWAAAALWLIAAIREPKTFLYPFLLPLVVGACYTGKTGALVVGGSLVIIAIHRIWRQRSKASVAPFALADKSKGKRPAPQ
ncbi:hypothetical protein O999_12425 [Pseudomonas putida LF54]|jgi:hypothetical protein|nr:hypothetical protein O999_12425 [Pseudomonas putida LF54]